MATFTRETISPQNERIRITILEEDYLPGFEQSLKKFSKTAQIPGFRKGMVPASLIRKMHGQALFAEEVVHKAEHELESILEKEKIEILGQPLSEGFFEPPDLNRPGPYEFKFEIGVKPDFSIPNLKKQLRLVHYQVVPTDVEMEKEYENFLENAAGKVKADKIESENDILQVRIEPASTSEGELPMMPSHIGVRDFEPSFREHLMGMNAGDTLEILPWKDLLEGYAGKPAPQPAGAPTLNWIMTIQSIQRLEPPLRDEPFFNRVFPGKGINTEEGFREEFFRVTRENYQAEAEELLHHEIFEELVHHTPMDLPEAFLKKWLQHRSEKPLTTEEADHQYPSLDHQLRWNLITDRLITEQDIKASPPELEDQAKEEFFRGYPMFAGNENALEYIRKLLSDKAYLRKTYEKVVTRKLFQWLVTQADLEEKQVTLSDFLTETQKHHHHAHS